MLVGLMSNGLMLIGLVSISLELTRLMWNLGPLPIACPLRDTMRFTG